MPGLAHGSGIPTPVAALSAMRVDDMDNITNDSGMLDVEQFRMLLKAAMNERERSDPKVQVTKTAKFQHEDGKLMHGGTKVGDDDAYEGPMAVQDVGLGKRDQWVEEVSAREPSMAVSRLGWTEEAKRMQARHDHEMKRQREEIHDLLVKMKEQDKELISTTADLKKARRRNKEQLDASRNLTIAHEHLSLQYSDLKSLERRGDDIGGKMDGLLERIDRLFQEKTDDKAHIERLEEENKAFSQNIDKLKQSLLQSQATNNTLQAEVESLRSQGAVDKNIDKDLHQLKIGMAYYVTQIDLAVRGLRVFTCKHDSFTLQSQGHHSTREKPMWLIANDMFDEWKHDSTFMDEYKKYRQYILDHHKAHEKIRQGRGAAASQIWGGCKLPFEDDCCNANESSYYSRLPTQGRGTLLIGSYSYIETADVEG